MNEKEFLRAYDPRAFPPFAVTVDVVLLTVREGVLTVLLVERDTHPFRGRLALPGGFVQPQEDLDTAAVQRLEQETGVRRDVAHVEQLGAFGDPARDPRMRVVSVAYLVFAPDLPAPTPGVGASWVAWVPVRAVEADRLAFDHAEVLAAGVERARSKLEYSPVATAFCGETFTIADLRRVYEAVWGVPLDPRNFHRKTSGTPGFLVPVGRDSAPGPGGGRPAALYRRGDATLLHPAMLRPRPSAPTPLR
ncbi:MAG TPA: NUDIX domain-containing protein [Mycobacteriales bacterium]|nr:NUDIX domain-containing protein [Mycobacteriales bacterium]